MAELGEKINEYLAKAEALGAEGKVRGLFTIRFGVTKSSASDCIDRFCDVSRSCVSQMDGGETMRNLAMFVTVVAVAYLAGRHLVPASAIDVALTWVFGLFQLSAEAVTLA